MRTDNEFFVKAAKADEGEAGLEDDEELADKEELDEEETDEDEEESAE